MQLTAAMKCVSSYQLLLQNVQTEEGEDKEIELEKVLQKGNLTLTYCTLLHLLYCTVYQNLKLW
jgi:hypothetical protein